MKNKIMGMGAILSWMNFFPVFVLWMAASIPTNSFAQVADGQPVNATTTNGAFLYKNVDDTALNRLTLTSGIAGSGPTIADIQRELNSFSSFTGKPINQVYNYLPNWTNNDVGASTDSVKTRADNLTQKFNASAGHAHDGSPGGGAQLNYSSILGTVPNSATTGTSANTPSTLVLRDGSGNFAAGTITASLTGTASGNLSYTPNNHGVLLSGSSSVVTVLAPDPTSTKVLTSQGSSADPVWATPGGGVATVAVISKTTTGYAIQSTDQQINYSGFAGNTTLPTAVGFNHVLTLCSVDRDLTHVVNLLTTSGQTINGYASGALNLASFLDCYNLTSDNANWTAVHSFDQGENIVPTTLGSAGAFSFTIPSSTLSQYAIYTDATGKIFTVTTGVTGTSVTMGGIETPASTGTLTLSSALYSFTISSATVPADCVYTNSGFSFNTRLPIVSTTTWTARGTGNPAASGTLTLSVNPGGCPATLTYSAHTGDSITSVAWSASSASGLISRVTPIVDIDSWVRTDATHACFKMVNSTQSAGSGGTGNTLFGLPPGMHINLTTSKLKPWADQSGIIGVTVGTDQPSSLIPNASSNAYQSGSFCPGNGLVSVFDAHSVRWSCIDNFGAGYLNVGPSYFSDTASTLTVGFCAPIDTFTP